MPIIVMPMLQVTMQERTAWMTQYRATRFAVIRKGFSSSGSTGVSNVCEASSGSDCHFDLTVEIFLWNSSRSISMSLGRCVEVRVDCTEAMLSDSCMELRVLSTMALSRSSSWSVGSLSRAAGAPLGCCLPRGELEDSHLAT